MQRFGEIIYNFLIDHKFDTDQGTLMHSVRSWKSLITDGLAGK